MKRTRRPGPYDEEVLAEVAERWGMDPSDPDARDAIMGSLAFASGVMDRAMRDLGAVLLQPVERLARWLSGVTSRR